MGQEQGYAGTELRRGCPGLSGFPLPLRSPAAGLNRAPPPACMTFAWPATELTKTINQHVSLKSLPAGNNPSEETAGRVLGSWIYM